MNPRWTRTLDTIPLPRWTRYHCHDGHDTIATIPLDTLHPRRWSCPDDATMPQGSCPDDALSTIATMPWTRSTIATRVLPRRCLVHHWTRYHWTRYHDTIGHDTMAMMPCPTMDTMPWSNTMPLVSRTYDPEPGAGFKHWTTICPSLACFKRQDLFQKTGPVSYTPRRQNRLYSQRRGKISRYPCSLPKIFYPTRRGFAI